MMLSGLAGVHGVERLNRKLGTRRMSILGKGICTYFAVREELGKVWSWGRASSSKWGSGIECSCIVYSRQKWGRTRNERSHAQRQLLNEWWKKRERVQLEEIAEVQSTRSGNWLARGQGEKASTSVLFMTMHLVDRVPGNRLMIQRWRRQIFCPQKMVSYYCCSKWPQT